MSRPSMFNSNYHKRIRRRKIIFRTLIVFIGLIAIFAAYNKSSVPNLKKMMGNLWSFSDSTSEQKNKDGISADTQKQGDSGEGIKEQKLEAVEKGEYVFKLSNTENLTIVFEKRKSGNKFASVKSDVKNLTYDIAVDGKKVVFDNPRTSDVWVYNIDGKYKKVNPDNYKEYQKAAIMKRYENDYVWAERPKFLKDGRVVYQSYLPWFKDVNSYYLWVVDSDGKNNRKFLNTDLAVPVKYSGFTQDGKLIIEMGGSKYWVDVDEGSKHKIN